MKRAAWISSKEEVNKTNAKQMYSILKKAAVIFVFIKENMGIIKFKFKNIKFRIIKWNV